MIGWKSRYVATDRGTFECFVAGQGKPLCTTHLYQAFTEAGNGFANVLAAYYQVIAVNLKGAGGSPKVRRKSELSMAESLKDLESIREALGMKQWSYAGHSTGGFLGLKYAVTYPESLERLILSGTAPSKSFQESPDCIYNFRSGKYRKEMTRIWMTMMMPMASRHKKALAQRRLLEVSLFKPDQFDTYFTDGRPPGVGIVRRRMRAYIQDLKTYDVTDKLPCVQIPTLVLCGAHDVQCPVENSRQMNALLPNSRLVVFNESNHFPFVEERAAYGKAIEEFAREG